MWKANAMPAERMSAITWLVVLLGAFALSGAHAQSTAFRYSDLDLRDPHIFVFVSFFGCNDVTDTNTFGASLNSQIQTQIQSDSNGDGYLDSSSLVEFLPLDQSLATNLIDSGSANCTAPMATTSCGPITSSGIAGDAALMSAGQCLSPSAGTVRPYNPAITSPGGPCFTSPTANIQVNLGGIAVTLRDAQFAATFVGNPATSLANGLVRGFLTETDANNTLIPATYPVIGGQPVSSILPGGQGNCAAHSDVDMHNGVRGWWFYLNFTAPQVARFVDNFADGFADSFEP